MLCGVEPAVTPSLLYMAAHTNIVLFLCFRASLKNATEGCGLEQARHGHAWEEETRRNRHVLDISLILIYCGVTFLREVGNIPNIPALVSP